MVQKLTKKMNFFTLIYIKTNRYSDEKIAIGMLANIDGIPCFGFSQTKLNFAIRSFSIEMKKSIKRSFGLLENDVNKFIKGEEPLDMFDMPYGKKILKKLKYKKRGLVVYGDVEEIEKAFDFEKFYIKYVGESIELFKTKTKNKYSFSQDFKSFVKQKKFNQFTKSLILNPNDYKGLYAKVKVDLIRKTNYFTVFQMLDISKSINSIQQSIIKFELVTNVLAGKAKEEGLGKGRYYLVYDKVIAKSNSELLNKIENQNFELIHLKEMKDKV